MAVTAGSAAPWHLRGTGLVLREAITGKCRTSLLHLRKLHDGALRCSMQLCPGVQGVLEVLSMLSSGAGWWHIGGEALPERLNHLPAREPVVN